MTFGLVIYILTAIFSLAFMLLALKDEDPWEVCLYWLLMVSVVALIVVFL